MGRQSLLAKAQRSPRAVAALQQEATENMNKPLKSQFEKIKRLFGNARDDTLRFYHQIGKLVLEVRQDPDKYGTGASALLEQALSTNKRQLRKAALFAEMYSDEKLQELIDLKSETGFSIHWGHMSYLLILTTEKQREEYARRAVANLWDPAALHAQVKRRVSGTRAAGHGRRHELPQTVHLQIRQMMDETRKWNTKLLSVWAGDETNAFENIAQEPPDSFTQADLDNLNTLKEQLETMPSNVERMLEQTRVAHATVERVLQARQQAQEALEASQEMVGQKQRRSIELNPPDQLSPPTRRSRRSAAAH